MDAQKLAKTNPDLHDKFQKIMGMDLSKSTPDGSTTDQPVKTPETPNETTPEGKETVQEATPDAKEAVQKETLPAEAQTPEPVSPTPPEEPQTSEAPKEPEEPKEPVKAMDDKPIEEGTDHSVTPTDVVADSSKEEGKKEDVQMDAKPGDAHSDTPPTNAENTSSPSEQSPDQTQKEHEAYEKILEKNMDEMAATPQTSGVTSENPPAQSPTPAPETPPAALSQQDQPTVVTEPTVGKPTKKKASLGTEILFALLGLVVLAVYTIIWMKLLNYKI